MAVGTVAKKVPQTIAEADRIVARIRRRRGQNAQDKSKIETLDVQMKQLRASIDKRDQANTADQELVQAFADAHRDELTNHGKTKSFRFPSGAVGQWGFPSQAALIIGDNLRAIARAILRLPNWELFIEIKPRKNNIKAHLEELHKASPTLRRGLREEKKERFRIDT